MLHHDKELFTQIILAVSEKMGIISSIIEKDYYVTLFLKNLVEKEPQIIFKGGTSLSKCYKLINRFSEDIDLNFECESKPTESQRKHLKETVINTVNDLEFTLTNPESIRSRRDFNKYIIDYHSVFNTSAINQNLIIETAVFLRSYPTQKLTASSYIYEYLIKENRRDIIDNYSLSPFEVNVQSLERTFIDKLFALGDYYLSNKITEHSRHIYDLYKIYNRIEINDSLKNLLSQVQAERRQHSTCLSAQKENDLKTVLQQIIYDDSFKEDYLSITSKLLFEDVDYDKAIQALRDISNSSLF